MLRKDLCHKTLPGEDFFWGQQKTLEPTKSRLKENRASRNRPEEALRAVHTAGVKMAPPAPNGPSHREGEPQTPSLCR